MTERSAHHAIFVLKRVYEAAPARVFAALAEKEAKEQWFSGPDEWGPAVHEMDFRVGGTETNRGGPIGGPVHRFECRYHDIVPNERIVYAYDMYLDDLHISVSLTTIELVAEGDRTRLTLTEQGAFLDGYDDAEQREHGTAMLLDALGEALGGVLS
ncbi:MAG: SRPBCC family protein [Acidimicrobiales bacterium]|jgi:uncharacterized protein YndB with AHSA1/START domain